MLNNSGVSGQSLLNPDFTRNVSRVCPLSMMLFVDLDGHFYVKEVSIYSYLIEFLSQEWMSNFFKCLFRIYKNYHSTFFPIYYVY